MSANDPYNSKVVAWRDANQKCYFKGYLRPTAKSFGLKIGHSFNK